MKRFACFLTAALSLLTSAGQAQNLDYNGSLGNLYANLYTSTMGAGSAMTGLNGKSPAKAAPRVSAPARWTINPQSSATIKRVVASVAPDAQAGAQKLLGQLLTAYPQMSKAAGEGYGIALDPNDVRDVGSLAGALAYQELSGNVVTNAQFAAERAGTRRNFAKPNGATAASMQEYGEKYAIAIGMMAVLKGQAKDPKNPNSALAKQQLRSLAQQTFTAAYLDADYTKFAATDKGIVKVK